MWGFLRILCMHTNIVVWLRTTVLSMHSIMWFRHLQCPTWVGTVSSVRQTAGVGTYLLFSDCGLRKRWVDLSVTLQSWSPFPPDGTGQQRSGMYKGLYFPKFGSPSSHNVDSYHPRDPIMCRERWEIIILITLYTVPPDTVRMADDWTPQGRNTRTVSVATSTYICY